MAFSSAVRLGHRSRDGFRQVDRAVEGYTSKPGMSCQGTFLSPPPDRLPGTVGEGGLRAGIPDRHRLEFPLPVGKRILRLRCATLRMNGSLRCATQDERRSSTRVVRDERGPLFRVSFLVLSGGSVPQPGAHRRPRPGMDGGRPIRRRQAHRTAWLLDTTGRARRRSAASMTSIMRVLVQLRK